MTPAPAEDAPDPEEHLEPYRDIIEQAREHLDIDREIDLVLARDWGAEPEEDLFKLYCPPHRPDQEHVFLHYLATLEMLGHGWKSPVFRYDERTEYLLANRVADSFTDFWAYHRVLQAFGEDPVVRYAAWMADTSTDEIMDNLEGAREESDMPHHAFSLYCYVYAVDWFGMAPVLLQQADKRLADFLRQRFRAMLDTRFGRITPPFTADRIEAVQDMYNDLVRDYPDYIDMVDEQEDVFRDYYEIIWEDRPPASLDGFEQVAGTPS